MNDESVKKAAIANRLIVDQWKTIHAPQLVLGVVMVIVSSIHFTDPCFGSSKQAIGLTLSEAVIGSGVAYIIGAVFFPLLAHRILAKVCEDDKARVLTLTYVLATGGVVMISFSVVWTILLLVALWGYSTPCAQTGAVGVYICAWIPLAWGIATTVIKRIHSKTPEEKETPRDV